MDKRTDEEKIKDIKSILEQLDSDRNRFVGRWQEAERYVAPSCHRWTDLDAIPEVPKRYSSSPCEYLSTLVSGLMGYSISPNIQWFKLSLENQKQTDLHGVKDWLEDCEEVLYAEFNRSNLYQSAASFIQNAAVIGHGVSLIEYDDKKGRLRFSTMRSNEIYLDCDESGEIDTVFRKHNMTLRNMVSFFGLENVGDELAEDYKDVSKWNEKHEVLFCVMPRRQADSRNDSARDMEYAALHVDLKRQRILRESGFREFPYAVFLWQQIPGLAYSESPATNAMPDIKFLNIAKKTSMQICQTSAEPPMRVSNSIRNISLAPRGFTYINTADEIVEPIRTGENYPITLQIVEGIKQDVKDWFNVDFFLMLQKKQGQMTATEVQELQGEKSAVLSNLVVSLNSALTKIISRSFSLLMEKGILPAPPESLLGQSGEMKIDFIGPLSQAQRKYHTMGGIAQAMALMQPIIEMFPNSGDFIDADELMKRAMNGQGMPQRVIREDSDVEEIRQKRIEQQQAELEAQRQMEASKVILQNADKLQRPGGNALAGLDEQMRSSLAQ